MITKKKQFFNKLLKLLKINNISMRINIKIPNDIHTALKVRAASESITLQQLIINILTKQK
jgi:predicted DNA binding CopG/RHH family protein